jgi:hypothetical protein
MTRIRFAPIAVAILSALPMLASATLPDVVVEVSSEKAQEHAKRHEIDRRARAAEREEERYDRATDALDEGDWQRAGRYFREVAGMGLEHADASLYWLAYCQNKMGFRSDALETLAELKRSFPKSRWVEDGKTLEIEIRQASGQQVEPQHMSDQDAKLMALSGLIDSDPARAAKIGEDMLRSASVVVKVKDKVLFVLSQSGDPQALAVVKEKAKDKSSPRLQVRAVHYLALNGGEDTNKALAEIYSSATDTIVRRAVLKAFLISGDKVQLFRIAKTEPDIDLRGEAVIQLGNLGAPNELAELYASVNVVQLRKRIIQAMFVTGSADKLAEIARTEKTPELRVAAIRNLGLAGGGARSTPVLMSVYASDANPDVRNAVIEAFFIQGNSKALRELLKKETDPEMKNEIQEKLDNLE